MFVKLDVHIVAHIYFMVVTLSFNAKMVLADLECNLND